jgi:hypothetical protein
VKLKQIVSHFGAGLSAEDKHTISGHRYGKVATRRRTVARLLDFFPNPGLSNQRQSPHVIESGVAVISGEYPKFVVINGTAVCRAGDRHLVVELPFGPKAIRKLIFV